MTEEPAAVEARHGVDGVAHDGRQDASGGQVDDAALDRRLALAPATHERHHHGRVEEERAEACCGSQKKQQQRIIYRYEGKLIAHA